VRKKGGCGVTEVWWWALFSGHFDRLSFPASVSPAVVESLSLEFPGHTINDGFY
jgi:hypothetical protein